LLFQEQSAEPAVIRWCQHCLYNTPTAMHTTSTNPLLLLTPAAAPLPLQSAGYDLGGELPLGDASSLEGLGEALLNTLKGQEEPRTVSRGVEGIKALGAGACLGGRQG
jgi:hypothetical protein